MSAAGLPRVTVVTPSFNQGEFIRATIESVLAQDYPNLEYLILDGGSTDGTAAIAAEYGSRLRFLSEPDRGQTHAINKGFGMAAGEVVAWLNSDDVYLPGAIRQAAAALAKNPAAGYVYGEGYLLDEAGAITGRFPHTQPFDLWRLMHLSDYILQQTCFFRRTALAAVGPLRESLHYGMDWDILIRLGVRYPVVYLPWYLACLREHGAAKTSSGGVERAWELHRILARHTGRLKPLGAEVYGLDTYSRVAEQWAAGRGWGWLRQGAAELRRVCVERIQEIVAHGQGLYPDSWAGPELHLMLHAGQGQVVLTGMVPTATAELVGQELRVEVNGRWRGSWRVEGNFRIAVSCRSAAGPVRVRVKAARYLTPVNDPRKLAFLFGSFRWEDQK